MAIEEYDWKNIPAIEWKEGPVLQQRCQIVVRGSQGYGKSTQVGLLVKWLLSTGQFYNGARIYLDKMKASDTLPKYPSEVEYRAEKKLIGSVISKWHHKIVIAEDETGLDDASRNTLRKLISYISRSRQIFTIIVTQSKKKLYDEAALEIVHEWVDKKYYYQVIENDVKGDKYEWTASSDPTVNHIIEAVQNGVQKSIHTGTRGKRGRIGTETSLYAQCMRAFNEGKKPNEVVKELNLETGTSKYQAIYVYHNKWKKNIKILLEKGVSGV